MNSKYTYFPGIYHNPRQVVHAATGSVCKTHIKLTSHVVSMTQEKALTQSAILDSISNTQIWLTPVCFLSRQHSYFLQGTQNAEHSSKKIESWPLNQTREEWWPKVNLYLDHEIRRLSLGLSPESALSDLVCLVITCCECKCTLQVWSNPHHCDMNEPYMIALSDDASLRAYMGQSFGLESASQNLQQSVTSGYVSL